jgi:hypothetical protein
MIKKEFVGGGVGSPPLYLVLPLWFPLNFPHTLFLQGLMQAKNWDGRGDKQDGIICIKWWMSVLKYVSRVGKEITMSPVCV